DPAKLFAYVRDQIRFDVYGGSLRGPTGALLSMSGNSIDKSLLLRQLLQDAGYTTRLARGRLSDALMDDLLAAAIATRPATSGGTPNADVDHLLQHVAQQSLQQYQSIIKTLSESGFVVPSTSSVHPECLRDHYWVQLQRGAQWIDLDSSFAK